MNKYIMTFESYATQVAHDKYGVSFRFGFTTTEEDIIEIDVLSHIADMVEQGNNTGELYGEDPDYTGWFIVSIEDDGNDVELRNAEVARNIREGNTSGHHPNYYLKAKVWKHEE